LKDYFKAKGTTGNQRIFPITSTMARVMVRKAGALVGVHLRPHNLRRHAATYASRSGVPVEIVSKVILRHANLSTTQRYLGKVSDVEAVRWVENLWLMVGNEGEVLTDFAHLNSVDIYWI
jgi:integrase/recombinase XerD